MCLLIYRKIHFSIARLNDLTVGKSSDSCATTHEEHLARIHAIDEKFPDPTRLPVQRIGKSLVKIGRSVPVFFSFSTLA
jgi:hypothetical protein